MLDEQEMTVVLSPATSYLVNRTFEEAKKRGMKEAMYLKKAEDFVEALLDVAIKAKQNSWKYSDATSENKVLRSGLDKLVAGKPLDSNEAKLVKRFQEAIKANGLLPQAA
jgi:hypothetical protein